jgi:hypothetical protein
MYPVPQTLGTVTGFYFNNGGFVEIIVNGSDVFELLKAVTEKEKDESLKADIDKIGKKIWNSTKKTRFKAHLGAKRVSVINEPDTD